MAARVAAIALLIAIWAHALLDFGGAGTADFFARWVHDAVFVVAALGCLAHAAAERRGRLPAAALGVGLLLVAVGDLIYSMAPDLNAVPVPSLSDPFELRRCAGTQFDAAAVAAFERVLTERGAAAHPAQALASS